MTVLRETGAVIEYDNHNNVYRMRDAGVFNYDRVLTMVEVEEVEEPGGENETL